MADAGTGAARFPARSAVLSAVTYAIELAIIAASYFSLAESTLLLPAINPAATPLWPPTGVALAFMLLRGYRVWPAILLPSFLALLSSFSTQTISYGTMAASWLLQSTSIAVGTTLAALVGAWLINHRSYGTKTFFTPIGIGRFVLVVFVPTAMISSASAILFWPCRETLGLFSSGILICWRGTPPRGVSIARQPCSYRRWLQAELAPAPRTIPTLWEFLESGRGDIDALEENVEFGRSFGGAAEVSRSHHGWIRKQLYELTHRRVGSG